MRFTLLVENVETDPNFVRMVYNMAGGVYDAVLIDCFTSELAVPHACRSDAFVAGVRRVLREKNGAAESGGFVLHSGFWHQKDAFLQVYHKHFDAKKVEMEAIPSANYNSNFLLSAML